MLKVYLASERLPLLTLARRFSRVAGANFCGANLQGKRGALVKFALLRNRERAQWRFAKKPRSVQFYPLQWTEIHSVSLAFRSFRNPCGGIALCNSGGNHVWIRQNSRAFGTSARLPSLDLQARLLSYVRTYASEYLGEDVDRAVISVPAYFNETQRRETVLAGERAGFSVERILNEPTAAALSYGLEHMEEESHVLV